MSLSKAWETFDPAATKAIPPVTGVYEIGDEKGNVVYIGYAGGREPFGIRGCIERHFSGEDPNPVVRERGRRYRYEVNAQYLTRHIELLTRHRGEHGGLPEGNEAPGETVPRLGRFGPTGNVERA